MTKHHTPLALVNDHCKLGTLYTEPCHETYRESWRNRTFSLEDKSTYSYWKNRNMAVVSTFVRKLQGGDSFISIDLDTSIKCWRRNKQVYLEKKSSNIWKNFAYPITPFNKSIVFLSIISKLETTNQNGNNVEHIIFYRNVWYGIYFNLYDSKQSISQIIQIERKSEYGAQFNAVLVFLCCFGLLRPHTASKQLKDERVLVKTVLEWSEHSGRELWLY